MLVFCFHSIKMHTLFSTTQSKRLQKDKIKMTRMLNKLERVFYKKHNNEHLDSLHYKLYELKKFIENMCRPYEDEVATDLIETIISTLILDKNKSYKEVKDMIQESLYKSVRHAESLKESQ